MHGVPFLAAIVAIGLLFAAAAYLIPHAIRGGAK